MFLSQPLIEVLAARGIEDIDAFVSQPTWSDMPSPFSIPEMAEAAERIFRAVRDREKIAIFGDYDCDGVLATHILRRTLRLLRADARAYLPHRDEGYGLSAPAVHDFSKSGTNLLITVDNGINARSAVQLAERLGIDVIVVDHHRIQERAKALAVWSPEYCGAGLATLLSSALLTQAKWPQSKREEVLLSLSAYAAIASIADCVPLMGPTRIITKLGLRELAGLKGHGAKRLIENACTDPQHPDSRDVSFGIAPRINAAGRLAHPSLALNVLEAASDAEAASGVERLNKLNEERRRIVRIHFAELVQSLGASSPAALVVFGATWPRGIAGLLASKCTERFSVPAIVLVPSTERDLVVGSGRSVPGFHLYEALQPLAGLFTRFGGHSQAIGLTMPKSNIETFREQFTNVAATTRDATQQRMAGEADINLSSLGKRFYEQLNMLEPFGEGNPAPLLLVRVAEISSVRNGWLRLRQGSSSVEVLNWQIKVETGMRGDFLIEFHGRTKILRGISQEEAQGASLEGV